MTIPDSDTAVCILQSYDDSRMTPWLQTCQASVRRWAELNNYSYHWVGDALFQDVPDWYMQKVAGRLAIAADLGRLQWMQTLLRQFDVVVWFDIDVLVFAPARLQLSLYNRDCVFGQEHWLQVDRRSGQPAIYRNVHNAYMAFSRDSSTLPFLTDTVVELMSRVDPAYIAPQFVGPKLLSSLHNTVGFALEPGVGAFSGLFRQAMLDGDADLLRLFSRRVDTPVYAANLCLSLTDDEDRMQRFIEHLAEFPEGMGSQTFT